jgi:hypothetical protein
MSEARRGRPGPVAWLSALAATWSDGCEVGIAAKVQQSLAPPSRLRAAVDGGSALTPAAYPE